MSAEKVNHGPSYTVDQAIVEIYKATATVYWPQYFDQWTVLLLEVGYEQEEVYAAIDEAKDKVKKKSVARLPVEKQDILKFASLITRYRKDMQQIASDRSQ